MTIQEFIKEYEEADFKDSSFIYFDSKGNKYDKVEKAYASRLEVTIKKSIDLAKEDLKSIGINSKKEADTLNKILSKIFPDKDTKKTGERKVYSSEDKEKFIKEWKEAEKKEVSISKFAKEKGINYQTFQSWIKKQEGGK
ncbi:hypothetical protein [Arthrospiribacter ruber]|uniref:Transposase n=1 Tax=Arthrospiribacter ruber TaxID=2487934 RepID=A0A951IZE3_9BACT|nr:hypothetical protein [Arthrospiribacter ruber]MBW3469069.1 hypothetical protein [Arthrospiribacter ruber]